MYRLSGHLAQVHVPSPNTHGDRGAGAQGLCGETPGHKARSLTFLQAACFRFWRDRICKLKNHLGLTELPNGRAVAHTPSYFSIRFYLTARSDGRRANLLRGSGRPGVRSEGSRLVRRTGLPCGGGESQATPCLSGEEDIFTGRTVST